MENKTKRLELETILSQIYNNNYIYDSPACSFSFTNISFISINKFFVYTSEAKIQLEQEFLGVSIQNSYFEIKYCDITDFSIIFAD